MSQKQVKKPSKYSFRTHCWNCNKPGHIGAKCRLPKVLSCSVCKKLNIKTVDCDCRADILSGLPTTRQCKPLRLSNNQNRLIIDVNILADNFVAVIDTTKARSSVHQGVVNYIRFMGLPIKDNTIDIDFRINKIKHRLNCNVHDNENRSAITLGLDAVSKLGIQITLIQPDIPRQQPTSIPNEASAKLIEFSDHESSFDLIDFSENQNEGILLPEILHQNIGSVESESEDQQQSTPDNILSDFLAKKENIKVIVYNNLADETVEKRMETSDNVASLPSEEIEHAQYEEKEAEKIDSEDSIEILQIDLDESDLLEFI